MVGAITASAFTRGGKGVEVTLVRAHPAGALAELLTVGVHAVAGDTTGAGLDMMPPNPAGRDADALAPAPAALVGCSSGSKAFTALMAAPGAPGLAPLSAIGAGPWLSLGVGAPTDVGC